MDVCAKDSTRHSTNPARNEDLEKSRDIRIGHLPLCIRGLSREHAERRLPLPALYMLVESSLCPHPANNSCGTCFLCSRFPLNKQLADGFGRLLRHAPTRWTGEFP